MKKSFEIAVIGGGPAGISAAIQATRCGAKTVLFEREKLGGLIRCANLIENFPGFYGKTGAEAAQMLEAQAKNTGVNAVSEEVKRVSKAQDGAFLLETVSGKYTADAVIIATGTRPRKISIPGLSDGAVRYWVEEPSEFSGNDVVIVGGGEAALDQAIRVSGFAKSANIVCRSKVKALPLLVERCAAAGIKIKENTEILGGEIKDGRITISTSAGEFRCGAILAFVGREPNLELLNKLSVVSCRLSEAQSGAATQKIQSKIPGLFLAGDLISGRRRQLAIAIGTGTGAALRAVEFIGKMQNDECRMQNGDCGHSFSPRNPIPESLPTRCRTTCLALGESHRTRIPNPENMKILCSKGDPKLAVVHVAQFRNSEKYLAEFVESLSGSSAKDEKWVIIVSSQFGCPVGCKFCDAGDHFHGNLTKEELLAQIDRVVDAHYPGRKIPVKKFKVQFARMGEPMLNPAVLDAIEEMRTRYEAPGLMPCISTIAPIGVEAQFERLLKIKNRHYRGNFQMQFSIHSTDEKARDKLMPAKKWSLKKIAEYGRRFHSPSDRKITLNFALTPQNSVDVEKIRAVFDPAHFAIKLTPVNPTFRASENRLVAEFGEYGMRLREKFRAAGFETIESIGDLEENKIGSNCGQVLALWKKGNV